MKFFLSRKKKEKRVRLPEKPKKNLQELIKEYNTWRAISGFENAGKTKSPLEDDFSLMQLKEIENQIINILPDEFQKNVFRILVRHKFDITDFLKEKDWKEILKDVCKKICHFLYCGSPWPKIPTLWKPLPVSGEEFFFHLLVEARDGREEDRVVNIFSALKIMFENDDLLGRHFDFKNDNTGGRLIVIFGGEMAKQSQVLIDIFCEVEGGEDFIKKLLILE